MQIVITHTDPALASAWRDALRERMPRAEVFVDADNSARQLSASTGAAHTSPHGSSPASAQFAVGWAPPAGFFSRHPELKAFFSAAAGVEHVLRQTDLPAALPVVRLEDAGMGLQMAEYACHEVFRLRARHAEYEQQQRDKVWRELEPVPRSRLKIGVLGLGVLGARVAQTLSAFDYAVTGYSRTPKTIAGIRCLSGRDGWREFLAASQVLILLAPLTTQTRGLINREALAALPSGAWLINLARGRLVDDEALLEALDSGQLAGASLDVFATEPLPADHRYWSHPKVRITPHVAALTLVPDSADQVVDKLRQWARGDTPSGIVDRGRGY